MNGEEVEYDFDAWYFIVCCDCHLTHYEKYSIKNKKKMVMKIYRDDWETNNLRTKISDSNLDRLISVLSRERRRRKK